MGKGLTNSFNVVYMRCKVNYMDELNRAYRLRKIEQVIEKLDNSKHSERFGRKAASLRAKATIVGLPRGSIETKPPLVSKTGGFFVSKNILEIHPSIIIVYKSDLVPLSVFAPFFKAASASLHMNSSLFHILGTSLKGGAENSQA